MVILRVQGNKRATTTGTEIAFTLDSIPINGNILIATIGLNTWNTPNGTVTGITQTGVTWAVQKQLTSDDTWMDSEIWLGVVGSGANASGTIALSCDVNGGVANICEYSGVATSLFLDKTASNKGNGWNPDSGTTASTTMDNELIIASLVEEGHDQTNPTNGFTLLDGVAIPGSVGSAYCEKIVSLTGTQNVSCDSGGANFWVGVIATFKASTVVSSPVLMSGNGYWVQW